MHVYVPGPPLKLAVMLYGSVTSWHQYSFCCYALHSNEWHLKELSIMWKDLQQLFEPLISSFFPFFHV